MSDMSSVICTHTHTYIYIYIYIYIYNGRNVQYNHFQIAVPYCIYEPHIIDLHNPKFGTQRGEQPTKPMKHQITSHPWVHSDWVSVHG